MLREVKRAALRECWFHSWISYSYWGGQSRGPHLAGSSSLRQLIEMKSDTNKILTRFVGAEGRARTCGRLTLQKIANQPTATYADRLMILVPIRSTVVSICILALPIRS